WEWWAAELEKRTQGKVSVELYWSQALGPAREQVQGVGTRIFECGPTVATYEPGKLPLQTITFLPTLEPNVLVLAYATADFANRPDVTAIFDQWNTKFMFPLLLTDYNVNASKPINKLDDFKGLKIRGLGSQGVLLAELGAEVINVPSAEVFSAMDKGALDGVAFTYDSMNAYGTAEAAKYINNIHLGAACSYFLMNKDAWNELPADAQQIIMELNKEYIPVSNGVWKAGKEKIVAKWKTMGVEIVELPKPEYDKMVEISRNLIWPGWVKDMNDKGHDGQGAVDFILDAVEKYQSHAADSA
ncbi:TRAP transporter substrate-binding protein DctP, partial [Chloroflexota bacterium]